MAGPHDSIIYRNYIGGKSSNKENSIHLPDTKTKARPDIRAAPGAASRWLLPPWRPEWSRWPEGRLLPSTALPPAVGASQSAPTTTDCLVTLMHKQLFISSKSKNNICKSQPVGLVFVIITYEFMILSPVMKSGMFLQNYTCICLSNLFWGCLAPRQYSC